MSRGSLNSIRATAGGNRRRGGGRHGLGWLGVLGSALLSLVFPTAGSEAAIRFKRTGEATLGGADSLAGHREICELERNRVWVMIEGQGDCIAYYASGSLRGASSAVIYFEGDIPSSYQRDRERLGGHLATMRTALDTLARAHKMPFVLLARPGTFGSTGSHTERRKLREYLVMREAVRGVSFRYGIGRLALAGQSGGGTIVGALLTLGLEGVTCAAPASGGYDLTAMLDWHSQRQGRHPHHREHPAALADNMNVMDRVGNVRADPARRIFIIGDTRDTVSPFEQQRRFAAALKSLGHHAEVIEAQGTGPDRHGLSMTSLKAAALCASGASDADIRRVVRP